MKDYRNPICGERCSADFLISDALKQTDAVEVLARGAGCISLNGEFNCAGPVPAMYVKDYVVNTGTICGATWKTPDIIHPDETDKANYFDGQIQRIMSNTFEFKHEE